MLTTNETCYSWYCLLINHNIIFFLLHFLVECAHLKVGTSFLKPNPYVELSVDDKATRKTEVVKCTYQPKWNEVFTV